MNNYKYDKEAQSWIIKPTKSASRFERKMKQICFCAIIVICVVVADAIAGGF